ncbi:MAG: hydroxylamine reductase [Kiritimatiellia bacterium]
MFCYQCEQTVGGKGCTAFGVCGKSPAVSALQDLLVYACKGISAYADPAQKAGADVREVGRFIIKALFTTVTNVNFDEDRMVAMLIEAGEVKAKAQALCGQVGAMPLDAVSARWEPAGKAEMMQESAAISIAERMTSQGPDITALQELLTYGLKGMAAYSEHARILGQEDDAIYSFFIETLAKLATDPGDVNELVALNLKAGEINLAVMGLLDAANTGAYGNPEPTPVRIHPKKGKAILVSGHDLKDLAELLKQTEGKGIHIYTHGEMLPAHGYPELKKYPHLAGNYGGAWQDQQKEFDAFPGAILMTTNCIQKPLETYKARIFTTGLVAWPGVEHVTEHKFQAVIDAALEAEGFSEDGPDDTILVGFGHHAVLGVADKVIDAVKAGQIKHFFLIGGCDGAKPGRNYYTDFAEQAPEDTVILTLACGKFRFNKLPFGDIGGIPRLLDVGQCNDAYSAIQIAVALANAFETDVNSLPLSLILSWYEQKAVCILLTLLHLGIRNIRLGPTLPAFVTPAILDVLVKNFNIMPITTPAEDLKAILG